MAKESTGIAELQEQLAEARAQLEAVQNAAADAEALGATARAELAEAAAAREALDAELAGARVDLEDARSQLQMAAVKYREIRLASLPEIPPEMVPEAQSLEDIDTAFEGAQQVVLRLREKMQEERPPARVPLGSPPRRAPDLSGLSAAEKIRLGLQERSG